MAAPAAPPVAPPDDGAGKEAALSFLDRDFNQNAEFMRYYDTQAFQILKFVFTLYVAVIGFAAGIYQFSLEQDIDLTRTGAIALVVALPIGTFMHALIVRNRVYFVQVARAVNEQRDLFYSHRPLGFANMAKLYCNPTRPQMFNPRSSQSWMMYLVAGLNGLLCSTMVTLLLPHDEIETYFVWAAGAGITYALVSLFIAITYLRRLDTMSADDAVFGRPGP